MKFFSFFTRKDVLAVVDLACYYSYSILPPPPVASL